MKKLSPRLKLILPLLLLAALTPVIVGWIRLSAASREAKRFAAECRVSIDYELDPAADYTDDETFLREICDLGVWARKTASSLNEAFGLGYYFADYDDPLEELHGFEPAEVIRQNAMRRQWLQSRKDVKKEARSVIEELYGEDTVRCGIESYDLISYTDSHGFSCIVEAADAMEQGDAAGAYELASFAGNEFSSGSDWVPMDVMYGLYPEAIHQECENAVEAAVQKADKDDLHETLQMALAFSERYGITVKGLDSAIDFYWELARKKEPKGSPSATPKPSFDNGLKPYYYINDYEIDPDEHDIEGYYEDNVDEYSDFDDAYDGFMDDDAEWDDY